ncbi:MAG: exonuclease SbcC [Thaumarchaeota archaeon]|jgi:peptidoglycan hydrolase CwlO-like protein|nr:exonuclease SbcC [Nitrososphaerota archaeon]MBT5843159.1 exonuclease SbcC [Nitrososphaerota archaeon]MBT6468041.1 exonuclease SbcC [Nitrososphaerota archaeon]
MVFGWGKKKQEEIPVQEIPQTKEIHLGDVKKIVTELYQLRTSQTVSEIKSLRDNTDPLITDLMEIGKVLEKDNLQVDDIDKHLAIIVVRGKKQVIDVIKKGVNNLPDVSDIDGAKKLNLFLNQILKKVGDVLGRQTRVIHIFAKKYANQLKDNLEIMNQNHSEIQKILKNFESTQTASTEINDNLNEIKTLQNSRIEKTQKIVETNKSIELLQDKISTLSNSIDEIKSSNDYAKFLNLKNELDAFASQKINIKNNISTQFTKISRPLSRYEYASSLDKDQKNILNKLVHDPFEILLPQNKDSIIIILENVRKGISSGSISVKDVEKTSSQITETEEMLDMFTKQVSEYFAKYDSLESEMNSLKPDNLDFLEADMKKNISFKDDSELKSETFQGEIDEADSKIPLLVSEIEEKLRNFSNTTYTVLTS